MVPALTASSPSFAIASMNSLGGGPKFSACLTIIMNCIETPLLCVLFCASELHFRAASTGRATLLYCYVGLNPTKLTAQAIAIQVRGTPRRSQLDRRGLLNARVRFVDLAKLAFTITN